MDILTMAMRKPKIINLNDYGIYLLEIMESGQTTKKIDGMPFINAAWKAFESGRIPIIHDESVQLYVMPSSFNDGQFTGSLVGALMDTSGRTFVKADVVIVHDEIALFTTMLN